MGMVLEGCTQAQAQQIRVLLVRNMLSDYKDIELQTVKAYGNGWLVAYYVHADGGFGHLTARMGFVKMHGCAAHLEWDFGCGKVSI